MSRTKHVIYKLVGSPAIQAGDPYEASPLAMPGGDTKVQTLEKFIFKPSLTGIQKDRTVKYLH